MTTHTDDFNRADGALGANWTDNWSPSGEFFINSNLVMFVGNPCGAVYTGGTALEADQRAAVKMSIDSTGYGGVQVRAATGGLNGYGLIVYGNLDCEIVKFTAGTPAVLASGTIPSHTAGDEFALEAVDTALTAHQNGSQILSTTDSTYSSGYAGIYGGGDPYSTIFDDFAATDELTPSSALAGDATAAAIATGALTTDGTEFVDQATGTNTATLPAHQAGDLILAFAFRDGNTTAPTVPSGQGWNTLYNSTGANTCAHAVAWKIAAGSSEGVGTFTNATSVVCHVYRPGAGRGLRVGANASGSGSSTSVSYTGLTLQAASGKSWVVGFAGHRSTNTSLETAPSGMVNRSTVADATDEAAGHDTDGPVSSWSTTSASVGGTSSGWRSHTVEVMSYALLAGDAVGGATAEGTLTDASTPIELAGAAVIAATASGSISTGIQLAGAAASVTLADGVLTVQIRLAGDAIAGAAAAAGLTTAIELAAAAQAGAQASGTLDTGGAALAGNAMASAVATGNLSIQIRLGAAAVAQAVAQGVLTTGISLNGVALASALAAGNLATAIQLAAAALASVAASGALTDEIGGGGELPAVLVGDAQAGAIASGDLSTGITMQAAAAIAAAAQGSLSTQIRMAGDAIAGALASGDITGAAQLAAAALATAVASGDLATAIRLAGAAQAAATASGTLSSVPAGLAGNAQALAIATGGLTTAIRLEGAAAAVVQAAGALDVGVTMQASAFAAAMASGLLLTQIQLDGAAVAGALASGYLEGSVPAAAPASRTIPVALELRTVPVAGESRRVPA